MSTLNQAFIKAYQRRGVAAPHLPLPPAPAVDAVVTRKADDVTAARAPGIQYRSDRHQADAIPHAHVKPNTAAVSFGSALRDLPRISEPTPIPESRETPENIPYEAATTENKSPNNVASLADTSSDDLRPAYEVERFEWPSIVTSLLDKSDAELGALVSELLPTGRGALLVTGCRRGEGRTSVALLLARHLAQAGSRVVLVDADFQRPHTAASLSTVVEAGWEETLFGVPLGDLLIESLADRLVLLPLRRAVTGPELATGGADFKATLARLQAEFDVVCIDGGPLIEAGESCRDLLFGDAPVEAAVVVRDVRHCRLEQSHAVGRKLVQLGASRWAIIENFV